MPSTQSLLRERFLGTARGVERHLDDPLDIAIRAADAPLREAEPAGDRGADVGGVEPFPFDRRRLHDVACQHPQGGLGLKIEAECPHPPEEQPLRVTRRHEGLKDNLRVPVKRRPELVFVDKRHNRRIFCGDYTPHSPHAENGDGLRYRGWLESCTSASMTRARAAASLRTR